MIFALCQMPYMQYDYERNLQIFDFMFQIKKSFHHLNCYQFAVMAWRKISTELISKLEITLYLSVFEPDQEIIRLIIGWY